ncbi:MAG: purinoceptor-like [Treponema sp.]|nr:purinoceptor-like [Treponema sp.]
MIILSVGLLGLIIYYAVSPKSTRELKFAATIALGVIGLAVIVCGIFIIMGPRQNPNAVDLPFLSEEEGRSAASSTSITDILIFLALFGVIAMVVYRSMKQQKKMLAEAKEVKPKKAPIIPEKGDINDDLDDTASLLDDESFDLGID